MSLRRAGRQRAGASPPSLPWRCASALAGASRSHSSGQPWRLIWSRAAHQHAPLRTSLRWHSREQPRRLALCRPFQDGFFGHERQHMTEYDGSKPKEPNARPQDASKDNGAQDAPVDPRILSIARADGRQIAQADTDSPVAHQKKQGPPVSRLQSTWASATPHLRSWPHVAKARFASALETWSATPSTNWRRTTRASRPPRGTMRHWAVWKRRPIPSMSACYRCGSWASASPGTTRSDSEHPSRATRAFERDMGQSATSPHFEEARAFPNYSSGLKGRPIFFVIFQRFDGGCRRTRTFDPLIKSKTTPSFRHPPLSSFRPRQR